MWGRCPKEKQADPRAMRTSFFENFSQAEVSQLHERASPTNQGLWYAPLEQRDQIPITHRATFVDSHISGTFDRV